MFSYHDTESAPTDAKTPLDQSQKRDAGHTRRQALAVLTGLASKLISSYTNALADTETDAPFQQYAWTHPSDR